MLLSIHWMNSAVLVSNINFKVNIIGDEPVNIKQTKMTELKLHKDRHISYIKSLDSKKQDYEYWLSEHLRLNGVYWGLTALCVLSAKDTFDKKEVVEFVEKCWDSKTGGFSAFPGHDAHILTTLSGIQILATYGVVEEVLTGDMLSRTVEFIRGNQLPDGSFQGCLLYTSRCV